ncbi:hypothetical protein A0J61_05716 [Choanephora cucurbitarum]|uniref:Zinc finger PHD-type domain-containing protein n=1 Tax=Choanephora cucurbitarum TaxID=101091 RepID=A0A1C7NCD8_9FUNG|nr:hypothetical protein A0J61_05716 [Choanephora cucurbitarum]
MTTATSTRNRTGHSGRRKQKIPEPVIASDEESVEDESVTRCVCGESLFSLSLVDSIGLMVCCDQCEVWQHCECMGLDEDEIPDQYFCELCKPSDHIEVKGYDKTRRYYKPSSPLTLEALEKKAPKRRTTFNSREASISVEEVLAFRNAIEQSKTYDASGMQIPNNIKVQQYDSMEQKLTVLQDYEDTLVKQVRPKRQNNKKSSEESLKPSGKTKEKKPRNRYTPRQSSSSNTTYNTTTTSISTIASTLTTTPTSITPPLLSNPPILSNATNTNTSSSSSSSSANSTRRTTNQHKASRSRTSTPQPESRTPTSCGSQLFEHFSQSARETSPPAKIRYPSHRMTIPDMNRRANQILEYICSLQVEMATKKRHSLHTKEEDQEEDEEEESQKRRKLLDAQISEAMTKAALELDKQHMEDDKASDSSKENRRPTPILIPGKFDRASSPSSSLSSASTIPLDDDRLLEESHEKSMAEEAIDRMRKPKSEQSSMEIMDLLTREVITFQRKFGVMSGHSSSPLDPMLEDTSDGPVTRSNRSMLADRSW